MDFKTLATDLYEKLLEQYYIKRLLGGAEPFSIAIALREYIMKKDDLEIEKKEFIHNVFKEACAELTDRELRMLLLHMLGYKGVRLSDVKELDMVKRGLK